MVSKLISLDVMMKKTSVAPFLILALLLVAPVAANSQTGNAIRIISPYFADGTWVFDDPSVDLKKEPFVLGIPEMIDTLLVEIPDPKNGFRLLFSDQPFPNYQTKIVWVRADGAGNWYRFEDTEMEGWLCPALFKYFEKAPKEIYVKALPRKE